MAMKKIAIMAMMAMLLTDVFASRVALAMPDENIIRNNCLVAQSTLSQIEKADAVVRINRGHDYNEILGLMFAMNARLATNRITAPTLTTITDKFSREFDNFRDHYDVYDDTVSAAITLKCTDQPAEFYAQLERARTARAALRVDVDNLNTHMRDYYSSFDSLVKEANL